ncbi:hypothetical protein CGRA01v4_02456 [Colletotrichum graminicola]|uniref:DUF7492 domain-containing protein n=1 Tax=Colletotrichum graminicola (strain M1.001 / M2 / FGSC 10212) TaxID=645133 RepID=E3Q3D4_COLGM|nr:uncharacterized protein GLRG_00680 [Colletotrichum graminicola M1.001]EFQ25536.1 hypothetical protein GLRG_00680 [Colletotrichum graminicola M1.001]WDK11177.1 hypothetical protein CGRA01v4_02456 [Colletotrichum graminicola]
MVRRNLLAVAIATILGAPHVAESHTWVEQLNRVAANGTLVGPAGFSAGWTGRMSSAFNDATFTNRIPGDGFAMCKQPVGQQVEGFPALTAAPGDFVSLRYQENGHVTLPNTPENKPLNRGTVFIYGTTEPKADDTLFDVHRQWTADGKGGDGRGRLLATRNFDDGQCYQINDKSISQERQSKFPHEAAQPMGRDVWCQSAVQLPEDLAQNSDYTLYWVWSWPTLTPSAHAASKNGQFADFPAGFTKDKRAATSKDVTVAELYTSCSSIKVKGEKLVSGVKSASKSTSKSGKANGKLAGFNLLQKPDYNNNAVKDQLANQFQVRVDGQGAPISSNPSNGTQSSAPTATAAPAAPTGATGVTSKVRVVTVTVTAQPVTLYSMVTVTAYAQSTPAPAKKHAGNEGAAQADVTPFLKGRHIRHRDSWKFGQSD